MHEMRDAATVRRVQGAPICGGTLPNQILRPRRNTSAIPKPCRALTLLLEPVSLVVALACTAKPLHSFHTPCQPTPLFATPLLSTHHAEPFEHHLSHLPPQ